MPFMADLVVLFVKCDAKPNVYLRTSLYYFIYIMMKIPLIFKMYKSQLISQIEAI